MEIVMERVAGLDVHTDTVVACVRAPGEGRKRRRQEVCTFGTVASQLAELADWLASEGVHVGKGEEVHAIWQVFLGELRKRHQLNRAGRDRHLATGGPEARPRRKRQMRQISERLPAVWLADGRGALDHVSGALRGTCAHACYDRSGRPACARAACSPSLKSPCLTARTE
jgi:hypothetical protein